MVVKKAASLKSKYQFGVVQDKVIEVPFSGDARQFHLIPLIEFGTSHCYFFPIIQHGKSKIFSCFNFFLTYFQGMFNLSVHYLAMWHGKVKYSLIFPDILSGNG